VDNGGTYAPEDSGETMVWGKTWEKQEQEARAANEERIRKIEEKRASDGPVHAEAADVKGSLLRAMSRAYTSSGER
jgi:hypothetical protein